MHLSSQKIVDMFKTLPIKRQAAFLDVLKDFLIINKKDKSVLVSPEMHIINKAMESSNMSFDLINPEDSQEDIMKTFELIKSLILSWNTILGSKSFGLFVYNKDKLKFREEISKEYGYIGNEELKEIYSNRLIFIGILEDYGLIEKIDIFEKGKLFLEEMKIYTDFDESKFTEKSIKEEYSGILDFTDKDNILLLSKDKITNEQYQKYIEVISNYFPYSDVIGDTNDAISKLKLSCYFIDLEKIQELYNELINKGDECIAFITTLKGCDLIKGKLKITFYKGFLPFKIIEKLFNKKNDKKLSMNLGRLFKLLHGEEYLGDIHNKQLLQIENAIKLINKKVKPLNDGNPILSFKGQVLREL